MKLQRTRAFIKEHLVRESLLYKIARLIYQGLHKIALKLNPPPPARQIDHNSIFMREDEIPMCSLFPKEELELVLEIFRPKSLLDVGCGTGLSMDYFRKNGVEVIGIEGSKLAISKSKRPDLIIEADLHNSIDLEKKFDLVWCFEVAEHIHPDYADVLVETIARHGDQIVLSAAQPGQGGCGHLNEQPPMYWIEKFRKKAFELNAEATQKFQQLEDQFAPNILVFQRLM